MVIVDLREKIVEFGRIFAFERLNHPRFQELAEGLGLLHRRQQLQAATNLVFAHRPRDLRSGINRKDSETSQEIARVCAMRDGALRFPLFALITVTVTTCIYWVCAAVNDLRRPRSIASTRWPSRPITVVAAVSAFKIASSVASTVAVISGLRCVSAR